MSQGTNQPSWESPSSITHNEMRFHVTNPSKSKRKPRVDYTSHEVSNYIIYILIITDRNQKAIFFDLFHKYDAPNEDFVREFNERVLTER